MVTISGAAGSRPRRRATLRGAVAMLLACAAPLVLTGATPTFWTVSTQTDFLKGEVENLSIDSNGRLFLGPPATKVAETAAPFLWTIVPAPDGALWAGTGNEGQVLKIARDGKVSVFFDAAELEVHALAAAPNGGLYVGTSPNGKIYEVAADGTSKTFFDPGDKYIWSLAVDREGNVYAATGDKGVIYKIGPEGKGSVFYKTNATNVVTLAFDKTGSLLAGTESPGRLFRFDAQGKPFVLLDSPFKELHMVRLADDGTIYAAAFSGTPSGGEDRPGTERGAPSEPPKGGVPTVSTEITAIAVGDTAVGTGAPQPIVREARRAAKGVIYRVRPDGLWDTAWESNDDLPYDLLIEKDGSLLVGTGTEGKLFRISGAPARATLVARASARQVTALLRDVTGRTRASCSRLRRNARRKARTTPTSATRAPSRRGERSAGGRRRSRARWRSTHGPATRRRQTRRGAHGRRRTRRRKATRSRARKHDTCNGAPYCRRRTRPVSAPC